MGTGIAALTPGTRSVLDEVPMVTMGDVPGVGGLDP